MNTVDRVIAVLRMLDETHERGRYGWGCSQGETRLLIEVICDLMSMFGIDEENLKVEFERRAA